MKHLNKTLKHMFATCVFSATSSRCLNELRLVDAELDAGTKLDATKVASAELVSSSDLDGAELARNTRLAGGSHAQR
jgi:hypothetical protein